MTVITSYPGVYLSEEASLNFSVTNMATAIPAFCFTRLPSSHVPKEDISCFNSWSEFVAVVGTGDEGWNYYESVKLWFKSGGGRCYLVAEGSLVREIPKYNDITLLVAAATIATYSEFTTLVQQGSTLFGLFDLVNEKITSSDEPSDIMKFYSNSSHAAVFYPWVRPSWKTKGDIPGSAVAAVAIAKSDRTHGVWKAPANVVINGITPNYPVSDDLQGRFNQGKALNMIRSFPDVGTVIWGARTLEDSDNWRYISVRRLFTMVERDIQKSLSKLVFEPNSQPTWQRVRAAIDNYLYRLWQQGALAGNKESDAWFVEIGKDITMTEEDINQGKMIVKIGLAAVRPAEFILLQFSQNIG